jgi:NAD(P)-dependent dehydrogenase (short-subunit alcohol dehydrogenase family)
MNWTKLLDGKVALITGAASGIGRATAQLFAEHGAKVVVADVNESGGNQTVENIQAKSGQGFFVRADVGKMEDVRTMVQSTLERFGRLDIVHSSAAAYKLGSATKISEADWDWTQAVCLKATWMIAHHSMPAMQRQEKGAFIITASVHSIRGYTKHVAYQAAKGGLLAMTRSLAADYAPQIRVNAILPGAVITGLAAGLSESDLKRVANMCPLRRNAPPEEIATVALFLASEMSAYMTGACLLVDGGMASVIKTE